MASTEEIQRVWTLGSYEDIGPNFLGMAAHLVEVTGVEGGDRVLDLACGMGNVAITAARRGANVTGVDITPAMLDAARDNAAIAEVEGITWEEGDVTDLPYADDTFDVTLSCVGHMFAQPPEAAAAELLRVTRSGGRIGFTCWTPESVVPAMGTVLQQYLPDDPGAPPPFLWGDTDTITHRLGTGVRDLAFETGVVDHLVFSPAHYWEAVRSESGLFITALENVAVADVEALREEVIETVAAYFDSGRNAVPMTYRLTTAIVA